MGWQLDVHESVLKEILSGTQVRHLGVFIDFLISHSNAHLSYTRNDKDLCDIVWVRPLGRPKQCVDECQCK